MSFALDIRRWANQTKDRMQIIPRKTALEILRRVVMRTPVDQGRARGNWQASTGSPIETEIERADPDGGATIEEAIPVIEGWEVENVAIYLSNNVPYIVPLEDGHSDQAPHGMVKITLAEFDEILEAVT
ncbi:hypothetical protein [Alkalispirochaeta alkalica]|uniref:hypothetical protein n=1 Tax=Alkalispirochaeta alkalica TaxID=46356 RepID=UPI00036431EB|nr:hypothetical protein [Alkalispirochaeta alkalica]